MCEIAVIDPDEAPIQAAHQIAGQFHEEQGDGVGVVAVKNHGDRFEYRTYKSIDPHWQTLYAFFNRNYDDAWRFVIHGRNATAGDVNRNNAHPIEITCQECEFEYVVHNGHVRNHTDLMGDLHDQDHYLNSPVDSEVIPHVVGELPDEVDGLTRNTYDLNGNLNYLIFSENGILVRAGTRYHLSDDFTMTCSIRDFDDPEELGFERGNSLEWMLITPDGATPAIESKERTVYTSYRSEHAHVTTSNTSTTGGGSSRSREIAAASSGGRSRGRQDAVAEDAAEDSGYTITYKDHCDRFTNITAIKVAPGVMQIIEEETGDHEFVYRDDDPRLYFWYAPDPTPDNIDHLEQLAEVRGEEDGGNARLSDFGEQDNVTDAIVEETTTTIVNNVDDVDDEDMDDVQGKLKEAASEALNEA